MLLHHIYLHIRDVLVFMCKNVSTAEPQLDVICGRLLKSLAKKWSILVCAAGAVLAATFSIPQRIWRHGLVLWLWLPVKPTVAKVVFPYEGWNLVLPDVVRVGTGAGIARAGVVLRDGSSESPDVLPLAGFTVSKRNAGNVIVLDACQSKRDGIIES